MIPRPPSPPLNDKVPVVSKIIYGLGTGLDMWGHWLYPGVAYAVFMSYLGVRPAWVGTALMLNRLLDAFSDPFFGWLSDNTRTRWGRRRPFLLFGGLAAGLGLPLLFLFIAPHWSEQKIFAYMLVSSILYVPLMSSFNMAFQSLGAEMTPDYNERSSVMSFKGAIQKIMEVGNFAGLQVATWAGLRFASSVGNDPMKPNTLLGIQIYTCFLGALMILFSSIMFFSLRERYYAQVISRKQERVRLSEAFWETLKCRPFRIQLLFTFAFALGNSVVGSLGYIATRYVVCNGAEQPAAVWNTWMGVAASVGGFIGALGIAQLANAYGKKHAAIITCLLAYAAYASGWWLYSPTTPWLQVIYSGGVALVCAGFWMLSGSMGADCMDYDEIDTGKRREGSFSACSSYTQKLGLSLGAGAAGWLLPLIAFDSKLPDGVQTATTILGIKGYLVGIPLIGVTAALLLVMRFPITREIAADIRAKLEARRGTV
ncbi:MAG: MFS transporter [Verrucomicrobia bacterium]|nr:MFS transporter [Verrucomicrobiota bacterium]